jgi:hypothetical protein
MVVDSVPDRVGDLSRTVAWVAASLLLTAALPAFAQTNAQANIIGVVTDESGGVMPGVNVSATSPSLQVGQVSGVTDVNGEYRLSNLPLGTYEVTYALDGFQSVKRTGVRLTAGFTARMDIPLKLGSLNETITVSGASPVVDVASSTPTTALTRETLELIPTSRNGMQALLAQAPGTRTNVDVGGNTAGAIPVFRAFGNSAGLWPVIEGVAVASPASNASAAGVYNDYSSFEEAQVSSLGNDAEVPTRGIALNAIVRSGGNTYHGSFISSYTNPSMISDNVSPELALQGLRGVPIKRRWDYGGDLSGFVVPDKFWFYGGARYRVNDNYVLDCTRPDTGGQCDTTLTQQFYSGKGTYQVNNSHRLVGYYQRNYKHNVTGASSLVDWFSRFDQQFYGNLAKGEWQGTLGRNVVANALVGYWNFISWQYPVSTDPSSVDIVTLRRWGSSTQTYYAPIDINWFKTVAKGNVSWYLPDSFAGDHNFKGGLDFIKGWSETLAPEHVNGNYQQLFRSNVPYQVQVFNFPIHYFNDDHYYGAFLMDEWRTGGGRLTFNLGFRLAFDRGFIREQSKEAGQFAAIYPAASYPELDVTSWTTFVPRLRATYQLTSDGKTVLKGGWGRFASIHGTDEANYVNRNVVGSTTYVWRDLNGNGAYDPGETNLDPNGPDFVSRTGTTQAFHNKDEKAPISDEYSASIERQLFNNFAVRFTGIYSKDTNLAQVTNPLIPYSAYTIPVSMQDPGPDGRLGTADDTGQTLTYWEYPTSLRGAAFQGTTRVNDSALDATFKSFEIAASKRFSQKWQAMASFSRTWLNAPGANYGANPNNQINTLNKSTEWSSKISGSYELKYEILASANYEIRSGTPFQRTVLASGGVTIPTIVIAVEPPGSRYYDNLHLLDTRVRKEFRLSSNHRAGIGVDIFNLLNKSTVTSVTAQSGASYGRVTTAAGNTATLPFLPGRNVQITFNHSF